MILAIFRYRIRFNFYETDLYGSGSETKHCLNDVKLTLGMTFLAGEHLLQGQDLLLSLRQLSLPFLSLSLLLLRW